MFFVDGRLVSPGEARIDPTDRGFLLGDGLFETMRARDGRITHLDAHLARLTEAAAELRIDLPLDRPAIDRAIAETLLANSLQKGNAAARLTLTRGPGPRGLAPPASPQPTLMIAAFPLPTTEPPQARVQIAEIRRNEHSPTSRMKTLCYLDNVLALGAARDAGLDDAILLNAAGRPVCATASNLFVVVNGQLVTPPVSQGVLPGITRQFVIDQPALNGPPVVERPLDLTDLETADEIFLTSSLSGIRPVITVDGRTVADGKPGPTTISMQAAWRQSL